jgi:hypothetical protein
MKFMGLSSSERNQLKQEIVSPQARLKLTRLLRYATEHEELNIRIMGRNRAVNIARSVLGLWTYTLKPDDWGDYQPVEYAWHEGELEAVMTRPETPNLIDTLADLIQNKILNVDEVNQVLQTDNVSVRFEESYSDTYSDHCVKPNVLTLQEIEERQVEDEHPNIRILFARMDRALEDKDTSGVLHASATIFETMAKIIVNRPTIENQTLKSFFERYKIDSNLPVPLLDYILSIYEKRNIEPLAGHGSTTPPTTGLFHSKNGLEGI